MVAGLTAGQIYSLPYTDGVKKLAEVIFPALRLLFTSINDASTLISGSASIVGDWNTHLTSNFTSVEVIGNEVYLRGGSAVSILPYSFSPIFTTLGVPLIHIIDDADCITLVSENAFSYCSLLTTVILPACVLIGDVSDTKNNYGAFQECSNLNTLYFPILTDVGSYAFSGCISLIELSEINLPKVINIYDYAFQSCVLLKISLINCNYIGAYSFSSNNNLSLTIYLPSVTILNLYYHLQELVQFLYQQCL